MSGWNEFSPGGEDDIDFSAPGPSKDFAPLKEQHDNEYGGGGYGASAGDDTCRK